MRYEYECMGNDIENLDNGIYWAYSTATNKNRGLVTLDNMTGWKRGPSMSDASGQLIHVTSCWRVRIFDGKTTKNVRAIRKNGVRTWRNK